jgi:hypothetical protein
MAHQNIYNIQLLNDLHNHFPELLYNPLRFQNVQEVLGYIISVANTSPYRQASLAYTRNAVPARNLAAGQTNVPVYPPAGPQPPRQPLRAAVGGGAAAAAMGSAIPPPPPAAAVYMTTFTDLPAFSGGQAAQGRDDGNQAAPLPNTINPLLNTLLGGLFGDILGTGGGGGAIPNLGAFLDTRVPVFPTADQINNATTVYRVNRRQDDICAICQDEVESNQEVRRLDHCNHYFHRNCIDTWFQGNVQCPTCRHDIRENNAAANTTQDNQGQTTPTAAPPQQTPNAPPPVPENYRRLNIRRQL